MAGLQVGCQATLEAKGGARMVPFSSLPLSFFRAVRPQEGTIKKFRADFPEGGATFSFFSLPSGWGRGRPPQEVGRGECAPLLFPFPFFLFFFFLSQGAPENSGTEMSKIGLFFLSFPRQTRRPATALPTATWPIRRRPALPSSSFFFFSSGARMAANRFSR